MCWWDSRNWIGSVGRARRNTAFIAAITVVLAAYGSAQVPVSDTSVRKATVDPTLLKAGAFVYDMSLERDASTTPLGSRTVSVATTTYAGSPSWVMLETRVGDRIAATDSLFVDPSLHPLHWSATLGQARLAAEFRATRRMARPADHPGTDRSSWRCRRARS